MPTYFLRIREPMGHLQVGDSCYLYHGCAKTSSACKAQTNISGSNASNIINFDGEPLTPLKNPQTNISSSVASASGKK